MAGPSESEAVLDVAVSLPLQRFVLDVAFRTRARSLAVMGASGAGKTSFLEVVCGLRPGAAGRLTLKGRVLLDDDAGVRLKPEHRRIGYVPQDALLFPHLRATDNVRFAIRGAGGERRFADAVEMTEIGPLLQQWPRTLSGGERQRVALARALASAPELLVLDEPLASLDVELKQRILPYLLRVRDEARVPLVCVTHHWGEARALAEDALLLHDGRVSAFGPASAVLASPALVALGAADEENVVVGVLETAGEAMSLRMSGGAAIYVSATPDEAGRRAAFALPSEDLLLSTEPLSGISARNVFPAQILEIAPSGAAARVRLEGLGTEWLAKLTAAAARELKLAAGAKVFLAVKTHSFRRLR